MVFRMLLGIGWVNWYALGRDSSWLAWKDGCEGLRRWIYFCDQRASRESNRVFDSPNIYLRNITQGNERSVTRSFTTPQSITLRRSITHPHLHLINSAGRMCMSWQLFDTLGIFIGSLANLVIFYLNKSHPDWRFMIALSSFPASLFLTLAIFCVGMACSTMKGRMKKNL